MDDRKGKSSIFDRILRDSDLRLRDDDLHLRFLLKRMDYLNSRKKFFREKAKSALLSAEKKLVGTSAM
jgi:hypothetical protein